MKSYVVYVNETNKKCTIHVKTCSFFKVHGDEPNKNGYWADCFVSLKDAKKFIHSLVDTSKELKICTYCLQEYIKGD
jgi:hypothetical protein